MEVSPDDQVSTTAEASVCPSGANATTFHLACRAAGVQHWLAVETCHSRTVVSADPDASVLRLEL